MAICRNSDLYDITARLKEWSLTPEEAILLSAYQVKRCRQLLVANRATQYCYTSRLLIVAFDSGDRIFVSKLLYDAFKQLARGTNNQMKVESIPPP